MSRETRNSRDRNHTMRAGATACDFHEASGKNIEEISSHCSRVHRVENLYSENAIYSRIRPTFERAGSDEKYSQRITSK